MKPIAHSLHEVAKELTRLQELEKRLTTIASCAERVDSLATCYHTHQRALAVKQATDQQLRLLYGELTAQEIRTIRAVIHYILP